ncbi:MAG: dTDP-4-dehydrorhamnose reductase [Bacteroidota bacterium]
MKRFMIIGSNGLLGQKVAELCIRGSNHQLMLCSVEPTSLITLPDVPYTMVDMTVKKEVKDVIASFEPNVIINCAAMTNVDACERERELAWKVNVVGVENIIEGAKRNRASIVHISSDYVFDGKNGPYEENDRPEPISYYGKTKLAGENALRTSGLDYFIARTMVLYGYSPGVKLNFALWLIQSLDAGTRVKVVDDQLGNPTLVDDLAYGLLRGVEIGKSGIFNIAGREIVSRYEFAVRLAKKFSLDAELISPVKTADLNQPAPRPLKSGLITLKAESELGITCSNVEEGLTILKSQISRTLKRMDDDKAIPGGRGTKRRSQ